MVMTQVVRPQRSRTAPPRQRHTAVLLLLILGLSLAARLVAIRHGLPHVYNADEELHYVPQATRAADGDWYSGYFENPSGYTYLLALACRWIFAGQDATRLLIDDPTAVFTVARLISAVLGTMTVGVVFLAGRAFFDSRAGLWAAAFFGFAYLPVFYAHHALNDVPTLLPLTAALVGCLRVYQRADPLGLVLTGAAVGVATGVKYLAAPMAIVIVIALAMRVFERRQRSTSAAGALCLAALASAVAFLALNPFIALEFDKFWANFSGQSSQAATAKLGQSGSAWWGYLQTLTWGFGIVPLALAAVGVVLAWRNVRARAIVLITFPVLLYVAMAAQGRYFGRWLMPAYPMLAVLAGYAAARCGAAWSVRLGRGAARGLLLALVVVALGQSVVDVTRSGALLLRTDTRASALRWIETTVPAEAKIVVEPAVPGSYRRDLREAGLTLYPISRPFQAYETNLAPELIDHYRDHSYCWVMVNGHQHDRGMAAGLSGARSYYARLDAESDTVLVLSPFRPGAAPPDFSYDFSFNYYPWAFTRPGPVVALHRLHDCTR